MQAIQVKYLSPKDTKPAFVKAWSYSGAHATLKWDDSIDDSKNFRNAAIKLLKKLEWYGAWLGGALPNGDFAFICIEPNASLVVGI